MGIKIGFDMGYGYVRADIGSNIISITNDSTLRATVRSGEIWALVAKLKDEFKANRGRALNINAYSMGLEIVGHIIPNTVCKKLNINPGDAIGRTDIIDCGESSVDGNRFVWDGAVGVLGSNALVTITALSRMV